MAVQAKYPNAGYILSILRIVIGFTFWCHGAQKLFGAFGGMGGHGAKAAFLSFLWVAGVLEFVGGLLIILGLFTRPVALIVCGEMAVAYFKAHAPRGPLPLMNGGELAVLYCFIFLYLFAVGGGPLSMDNLIRQRKF